MILRGRFAAVRLAILLDRLTVCFLIMKLNRWIGLAALTASVQFLSAADVTGKITLKGTPPPPAELAIGDKVCGDLMKTDKVKSLTYVVGPAGELADTVVFIKEAVPGAAAKMEPFVIDQKNCLYVPDVGAAQVNQQILVKNSDPVGHNVHTLPSVQGNKAENIMQFPKAADLKFKYANAEPFMTFKCDIHGWMLSYIYFVDSPFFAVSQKDGTYKISGVPKGKYTLVAHHRRGGKVEQPIEVTDTGAMKNFELEVPAKK
jgi:hypothetical protein